MDWRRDAHCRGSDPSLFFPSGSKGLPLAQAGAAKRVCSACVVRQPCLQYALETNQDIGVWGGTSEEERRVMRLSWLRGPRRRAPG
ncbi:MAG TPA: WhiB family transcriptional regulator [Acidimicrobiales bacterium]|jgi:WhiB family redox-sensing transcriptional regulator|nr:WhiB family transcriptional regulator [Acidimicrobiales bacterium]